MTVNENVTPRGAAAMLLTALMATVFLGWAVINHVENEAISDAVAACERKKQDRVDNARGWTAMENYYAKIAEARSLKQDVKVEINTLRTKLGETANQLRTRILDCPTLIKDDRNVLDERLLREAQGDL
jgi:hypothetical protein